MLGKKPRDLDRCLGKIYKLHSVNLNMKYITLIVSFLFLIFLMNFISSASDFGVAENLFDEEEIQAVLEESGYYYEDTNTLHIASGWSLKETEGSRFTRILWISRRFAKYDEEGFNSVKNEYQKREDEVSQTDSLEDDKIFREEYENALAQYQYNVEFVHRNGRLFLGTRGNEEKYRLIKKEAIGELEEIRVKNISFYIVPINAVPYKPKKPYEDCGDFADCLIEQGYDVGILELEREDSIIWKGVMQINEGENKGNWNVEVIAEEITLAPRNLGFFEKFAIERRIYRIYGEQEHPSPKTYTEEEKEAMIEKGITPPKTEIKVVDPGILGFFKWLFRFN